MAFRTAGQSATSAVSVYWRARWNPEDALMLLVNYLAQLPASRKVLWSYVIWWAVMVSYYFTAHPRLWATSLGIGVIVGFALMLSTGPVSRERFQHRFWESMRLFICPLLVSSFSALVAGKGFILVFSPHWQENAVALGAIGTFLLLVATVKKIVLRGVR